MSVRAYRVNAILRDDEPSFNLWADRDVVDWLEDNTGFYSPLNMDACGMTEVEVSDLKRMVKQLTKKVDADVLAKIKDDIAWAEAKGNGWIEYDCF